jgi:IS30 family transposase
MNESEKIGEMDKDTMSYKHHGQAKGRRSVQDQPRIGKNHQGAWVTLVERKSRYTLAMPVDSKQSGPVTEAIFTLMRPHKNECLTLTFDNGKEFAEHVRIAKTLKAKVYFARPYHSWERGLNENTNGLLRQYFPKSTNLLTVCACEVDEAVYQLNHRPRKCLGYRTPHEAFYGLDISLLHYPLMRFVIKYKD